MAAGPHTLPWCGWRGAQRYALSEEDALATLTSDISAVRTTGAPAPGRVASRKQRATAERGRVVRCAECDD